MPHNTGNPVPSKDTKDLEDNSLNFDTMINGEGNLWMDRTGKPRPTLKYLENQFGVQTTVATSAANRAEEAAVRAEQKGTYYRATRPEANLLASTLVDGAVIWIDSDDLYGGIRTRNVVVSGGLGNYVPDTAKGSQFGAPLLSDAAPTSSLTVDDVLSQEYFTRAITPGVLADNTVVATWTQGKQRTHGGRVYVMYNGGSSHISNDLRVYLSSTADGHTWTEPRMIYSAPGSNAGGSTCWGFGITAAGVFWMIVRVRGTSYNIGSTYHVLLRSTDLGVTWTEVVADIGFNDGTKVPVLYHDFCELPNGNIAFGYHFETGRLGFIKFNTSTYAFTTNDVYAAGENPGNVYVEPTIIRSGNALFGFFRSQNATTNPPKMWRSDDNLNTYTLVDTTIGVSLTPIPLVIYDGKVYVTYADRNRTATNPALVYLAAADLSEALALNWSAFKIRPIAELNARTSGSSSAGVPAMSFLNDSLVITVGDHPYEVAESGRVCFITLSFKQVDYTDRSRIIRRSEWNQLLPSHRNPINIQEVAGEFNVGADPSTGNSRYRLGGRAFGYYDVANDRFEIGGGSSNMVINPNLRLRVGNNWIDVNKDGTIKIRTATRDNILNIVSGDRLQLNARNTRPMWIGTADSVNDACLWMDDTASSPALRMKYGAQPEHVVDGTAIGRQLVVKPGNANIIPSRVSDFTAYFDTPITANRTVTGLTTYLQGGEKIRVVRTADATGAFNITSPSGKELSTTGTWCVDIWDGTSWILIESGTL